MPGVLHAPTDGPHALEATPRQIIAALSVIAWRAGDPVTRALVAELIGRMVYAPTDGELYSAVYGAVLYATGALAEGRT